MRITSCAVLLAFGCVSTAVAAADAAVDFPSRPLRFIVPFTPGTGMDNIARLVGEKLFESWKQPVIVENKTGLAGHLGAEQVARSAPDGYTLVVTASNLVITSILYPSPTFNPMKDLTPVMIAARGTNSLAVNPGKGYRTMADLVAAAKANPGKINFASAGVGSPSHILLAEFEDATQTSFLHVPYKGTAPGVNDVIAGHVDAMFVATHTLRPFVESGQLRNLGVSSPERQRSAPGVPSFAELGITPGMPAWYGFLAPKGTPAAVIDKLNKEMTRILELPDVKSALEKTGLDVKPSSPQALQELMDMQLARFTQIIRKNNITAN